MAGKQTVRADSLGSRMSGKERLEAALRFQEVDRVPWAPKVFIGHYRSGTSARHQEMSVAEFADVLNCDAIAWDHLVERHYENVETETIKKGNDVLTIRKTPVGELRSVSSWPLSAVAMIDSMAASGSLWKLK